MKYVTEITPPQVTFTEKKALAKKTGQSLSTIYRILSGDIKASDKFLKALWGKEKYDMWISRLHESANSVYYK